MNEASESSIKYTISRMIADAAPKNLLKNPKLRNHHFDDFSVVEEDFQTLKIQFRALGLIIRSEKSRGVRDNETYWRLTPHGDDVITRLHAIPSDREIQSLDEDIRQVEE